LLLPAGIAAQEAARREAYLQLELPQGCLLWVDDPPGCDRATLALAGSREVGLDVEVRLVVLHLMLDSGVL
jgi:hypothetical protein